MTFIEKIKKASLPFKKHEHDWKPLSVTEKGAWIAYYVDMRRMVERLQSIFGATASIHLSAITRGEEGFYVLATLTVNDGEDTVTYQDFGYAPDNAPEGYKSAATDAIRRVLVHVGIGRYLYHLPKVFIGGQKKGFRFVPNVDPLDVLEDQLSNMEKLGENAPKIVFVGAEEDDAYAERSAGEKNRKSDSKGGSNRNGNTERVQEWLSVLETETIEDAVSYLRTLTKQNGASYTDKQLSAFIKMVDASEVSLSEIERDPTVIKSLLDRAFAKLRK